MPTKVRIRYMLRQYEESMGGRIIPDHLVTRAPNGRYWKNTERELLKEYSMDRSPTYGLCCICCSSGPVGMHCQKCRLKGWIYKAVKTADVIIDATWVSRFFWATHMDALADRQYQWLRTPTMIFKNELLRL